MSALASPGIPLAKALKTLEDERRAKVKKAKGAAGKNKAKQKEVEAAVNAVFDNKRKELEEKYAQAEAMTMATMTTAKETQEQETTPSKTSSIPDAGAAEKLISDLASNSIQDKKEKARLKKLKKQQKKRDEEARIQEEMSSAGPSNRVVESAAITTEVRARPKL